MMLSQGQFAAFLNAPANERAELLEELTGSEIYGLVSQQVFENYKSADQQLQILRAKHQGANLLSAEEIALINTDALSVKQQLDEQLAKQKQWQTVIQWKTNYADKQTQCQVNQTRLTQANEQATLHKDKLQGLQRAEPADALRLPYEQYQQLNKQKENQQQSLNLITNQLQQAQQQVEVQLQQLNNLTLAQEQQEKVRLSTESLIVEQVLPLDNRIAHQQQQIDNIGVERNKNEEVAQVKKRENEQLLQQQKDHQSTVTQLSEFLETHNVLKKLPEKLPLWKNQFTTIEQETERLKQQATQLTQLQENAVQLASEQKNKQGVFQQSNEQVVLQQTHYDESLANKHDVLSQFSSSLQHLSLQNTAGDKNPEQALLDELAALQSIQALQNQALIQAQRFSFLMTENTQYQKQIITINQQCGIENEQLVQLRDDYRKVKQQHDDVELIVNQQKTIMALAEHRANLQESQPCPLCGAEDHPAVEQYQKINVSEQQNRLQAYKKQLLELEAQGNTFKEKLTQLQAQLASVETNKVKNIEEQSSLEALWLKHNETLLLPCAINDENTMTQWVEQHQQRFTFLSQLNSEIQKLNQRIQQQHQQLSASEKQQLTLQSELQLLNSQLTQQQQSIETLVTQNNEKQAWIHQQFQLLTDGIKVAVEGSESTYLPNLLISETKVINPSKFVSWWQQLNQDIEAYLQAEQKKQLENERLNQVTQLLAVQSEQVQQTLNEQQRLNHQSATITDELNALKAQRHTLFSDRNVAKVRQQLLQDNQQAKSLLLTQQQQSNEVNQQLKRLQGQQQTAQTQYDELDVQNLKAQQRWGDLLSSSIFNDESEFTAALLSIEAQQELKLLKQTLEQEIQQAVVLLEQSKRQLVQLEQEAENLFQGLDPDLATGLSKIQSKALTTLEQELVDINESISQLQRKQGEFDQRLSQDQQQKIQQQAVLVEIEQQQTTFDDLSYLNALIGSAQGDKFRRFAQGLTLAHLVYLANQQLERLHARYQLQCHASDTLALEVLDTWQADTVRDTKTLSGGESFLVSLALALALSDLVSTKTHIDSLFLDEGFGTLDNDTLEIALDALDNLNASGKMIGIISHVETLKERIAVQIKVKKRSGLGVSSLDKQFEFIS